MSSTAEIALVSVPMAAYLYALGIFHGGKHPRVVGGSADLAWLMAGLSGLVAVGPVGRTVVRGVFGPGATVAAWLAWGAALVLAALAIARSGRHRVVVYHVEPDQVRTATGTALASWGGEFAPTLNGFEDASTRTGVTIRASPRTRTAVVEVEGNEAGPVTTALRLGLRASLRRVNRPVSTLSTAFFAASGLVMAAPVVGFVALDPRGRRAARTVARWLGWG